MDHSGAQGMLNVLLAWLLGLQQILQYKLEPITGIPPDTAQLSLYQGDSLIGAIDDDSRMLGSYPIEDYMRLHVSDPCVYQENTTNMTMM